MPRHPPGTYNRLAGANIRTLREAQRVTLIQLAEKIEAASWKIDRFALSNIEKGARSITIDDLMAIAQALGVRPEELLRPFECTRCQGKPPEGFTCQTCGAS